MILDGIFLVLQGVLNIILAPLTVLNISIDFISNIPVVFQFLQIVAYIIPWSNLLPIFVVVIAIFVFKIGLTLIKLLINFIPFF